MGELTVPEQIGYGVGTVAYVVVSIPVGLVRMATAVYYLAKHHFIAEGLKAQQNSVSNEENSKGTWFSRKVKKVADYVSNIGGNVDHSVKNALNDEMSKHWKKQLLRGATEVFVPIIAPSLWSQRDLTQTKFQAFKNKMVDFVDENSRVLDRNLAGVNDFNRLLDAEDRFPTPWNAVLNRA